MRTYNEIIDDHCCDTELPEKLTEFFIECSPIAILGQKMMQVAKKIEPIDVELRSQQNTKRWSWEAHEEPFGIVSTCSGKLGDKRKRTNSETSSETIDSQSDEESYGIEDLEIIPEEEGQ
jgi:hypothetical protein